MSIDLKQLYTLFFTKELVKLSKLDIVKRVTSPLKKNKQLNTPITPISKMILSTLSPDSKSKMLEDLRRDDLFIMDKEEKTDQLDPDYQEKMSNNGLGFFMENYVSWYGLCPLCGQHTLRKYLNSNVPVVDFVCINVDYHLSNNLCFLFQLKISLAEDYFNFINRSITVGSQKYGLIPHTVRGSDDITHKILVPGYICVKLRYKPDENMQVYQIDNIKSFVLIPDYSNMSNVSYYKYVDNMNKYGKNVITWNSLMMSQYPIQSVILTNMIKFAIFSETSIMNPYNFLGLFE